MSDELRENETAEDVVDQPQSEPQEVEQPQEDPESAPQAEDTDETLTNEVPDKNAAWAAMRAENAKLKRALEDTGVDPQYLEDLRQVTQHSPEYQPSQITPDDDYDKVTGAVNQTSQVASSALREASMAKKMMREMEDRMAEMEYPELRTDPGFQQLVAERRLALEITGKRQPTVEIARSIKKQLDRYREQVVAQTTQQQQERQTAKQQATAQPQTQTSSGRSAMTDDELRHRFRKGDESAQMAVADQIIGDLFE